ncbi:MAG: TIGR01777 family protein [Lentisphaerae bacterium RIFOXYB12_FULL_65_16]|nr:MAG: TIGR01777 family protein [Lentisphaerae bacterium RIFOXYA12_64_32]OGV93370.1 MAG: TIGR01777 family protein [Lentisphaerae bacterium RIFOXYB12_FULL_65_16]
MRLLITGSNGLVGSALVPALTAAGHSITRLVHSKPWPDLAGHDAVVNLAGDNIAVGRWTPEKKARIRDSRVQLTQQLAESLAKLTPRPRALISASAIGYYGNRGDEVMRDESLPALDFLAGVCCDWEAATKPATEAGIRVACLRFGVILSGTGGALARMLTPFKLGAGGVIGNGRQWMSWITLDDVVGTIQHALTTDSLRGPVNTVAPNPVTNREFANTLGCVLRRPTLFPMPAFAARLAFGEVADALLLASQRVEPAKLAASGYRFQFPELDGALRHLLR